VAARLIRPALGYCNRVQEVCADAKRIATRNSGFAALLSILVALAFDMGCQRAAHSPVSLGITPERHTWFAIGARTAHQLGGPIAEGKMECQSCHPADTTSFTQIMCVNCHGHDEAVTDRLHLTVPGYAYSDSAACYSCHPKGDKTPFDHAGISNNCAMCHDAGDPFAALPKANLNHPDTGGIDCAGCHNTSDWKGATGAPNAHDPAQDILVAALLPTYAGTSMVNVTAQVETLSMTMNHGSTDAPAAVMSDCARCHPNATGGVMSGYFPGHFHDSLAALGLAQPLGCASCHLDTMPTGLVGSTSSGPARVPAAGEMRHEAVAWVNDAPTATRLVTTNCGVCHRSPSNSSGSGGSGGSGGGSGDVTWATGKDGNKDGRSGSGAPVQFHAALASAAIPQPASCLDCHAHARPVGALTSGNAALSPGVAFDHAAPGAQGDCAACHAAGAAPAFTSWRLGKYHLTGSATPSSCLPCHAGERPTSTAGWTSTTYKNSPFDYLTNAAGSTHGDGQDCALCHRGPGTGAWGATQNWASGRFDHGPDTAAATSCIVCHSTQRPDLQPGTTPAAMATALGFDHATNGTGECIGCHAATVTGGRYVNYNNPTTRALPGGDWKGGVSYPGSSITGSADQFINVTETTLIRDGTAANMVTGTTTVTDTIYNGMLHVSSVLPAPLAAGPTSAPDNSKCWHCHTNSNGVVTAFRNGQYHAALTSFRATPSAAVAPFPQPTARCADCHASMTPDGVVEKDGSSLWPMDHRAVFATPVTVAGQTVAKVSDIDCSVCHKSPGVTWADGTFHPYVGSAVVKDCVSCHYLLIADTARADLRSGTSYAMKHGSKQLVSQTCQTCHPSAVGARALLPATADLWKTGTVHSTVTTQPTACLDCHLVSQPGANLPTQSSWSYALKVGGTASNGAQWMNHGSSLVAGKDCAACHQGDAQASVSGWSRSISLHAAAPGARTCQECHGLINGGGGVAGTNNNLPAGLTSATLPTSASAATGIAPGTLSQIDHADINAATRDCNFCHTQVGPSASASLQGKEWTQARFHASFTPTAPLVMNATTGRCSNCHLNVKPKSGYTTFNHGAFSGMSGSQDCSGCHVYPGTGTTASPNWRGAATVAKN